MTVENLTFEATLLGGRRLSRAIEECLRLANTDAEFGAHENLAISTIQQLQTDLQRKNTAEDHWRAPESSDFQITTDLQLKNIAEDYRRARKSSDFQTSTALKRLGPVTPKRVLNWLFGAAICIPLLVWTVQQKMQRDEFRSTFENRIRTGMSRTEVIERLGKPHQREGRDGTMTILVWGDTRPFYSDEFCLTIRLSDGVVVSKNWESGTWNRNN